MGQEDEDGSFFLTMAWALFTIASSGVSLYGLCSPNWVESETYDVSCGPIAYCTNMTLTKCAIPGTKYGDAIQDVPGIWWQVAAWLLGIGATLQAMCFLGIFTVLFCSGARTMLHNCICLAGILLFLGTIFGLVGFKDLAMEGDVPKLPSQACRICSKKTSPFVLVDCGIGDGLIIAIVGCVVGAIAACLGYANTPSRSSED